MSTLCLQFRAVWAIQNDHSFRAFICTPVIWNYILVPQKYHVTNFHFSSFPCTLIGNYNHLKNKPSSNDAGGSKGMCCQRKTARTRSSSESSKWFCVQSKSSAIDTRIYKLFEQHNLTVCAFCITINRNKCAPARASTAAATKQS